jgi:hypothetical protein
MDIVHGCGGDAVVVRRVYVGAPIECAVKFAGRSKFGYEERG